MITNILKPGTDDACCGCCKHMEYEDTDGHGHCEKLKWTVYCGDVCDQFKNKTK